MSSPLESISKSDADEIYVAVRDLQSSWKNRDYALVTSRARALLARAPGNLYGLTYLVRAAAHARDWDEVAWAAAALTDQSPREAFAAATKLSRAGHKLEAAKIYASLDFGGDWLDDKLADMAIEEGLSCLKAGEGAAESQDAASARVFWVAAARLAPRSQRAIVRRNRAVRDAKDAANAYDPHQDPVGYIQAWREVLWCIPSDIFVLARIAQVSERVDVKDALAAWLKILAVDPDHKAAGAKIRALSKRHGLEDDAIRGLIGLGRDGRLDPLILELARDRDAKARAHKEKRAREALHSAQSADKSDDLRRSLVAWKDVLALDPTHLAAARRVVIIARQLNDQPELVEGLTALLEINPENADLVQKLATAALRAGQEQRVLDYLSRKGLVDLSVQQVAGLHGRVLSACKNALKTADFDKALSCFRTLERVDANHMSLGPLRSVLADKAASNARGAEKDGNLAVAVPLAEQVLQIVPDQPVALLVVARDLWRHKRFGDIVKLCKPQVKSGPEYASVQKLLERAAAAA